MLNISGSPQITGEMIVIILFILYVQVTLM